MGLLPPLTSGEVRAASTLHGVVERDVALPGEIVFEESELPGDAPLNAGEGNARGADEVKMIESAVFGADKRAGDLLVGIVAPGRWIGGGAGKSADGEIVVELAAVVTAVDGAQAGSPGKIEAADADDVGRVGILIGETQDDRCD